MRRIAACGLFLLLGSLPYTFSLPDLSDPGHIAAYRDQGEVTLWGRVVGEPDVRDTYTNLRLAVDRAQIEDEEHQVKGMVLVDAPCYPAYVYGDELEVEGELETPPVFEDFSYPTTWPAGGYMRWLGGRRSGFSREGKAAPCTARYSLPNRESRPRLRTFYWSRRHRC